MKSGLSVSRTRAVWPVLVCAMFAGAAMAACGAELPGEDRVAERVTLKNGFELICDHREESAGRVKLFTEPGSSNFVEVTAADIAAVERVRLPVAPAPEKASVVATRSIHADLTPSELHELLSSAGASHNLDVHLLASVVRAESGGHTAAVSRKGAQGLMQLMPGTAAQLGVEDSLRADQNVAGGAAYLDSLLTRYHENLGLALAAYNAGPAAVDRWHGVPPYRETRQYVARIIRDFNASVRQAKRMGKQPPGGNLAEANPAPMGAIAR